MPPKHPKRKGKDTEPRPARLDAHYEGWPVQVVLCRAHKQAHLDIQGQVILAEDEADCWLCQRERAEG